MRIGFPKRSSRWRGAASGGGDAPRTVATDARVRLVGNNFMRLRDHVLFGADARLVGDFFGYADHLDLNSSCDWG